MLIQLLQKVFNSDIQEDIRLHQSHTSGEKKSMEKYELTKTSPKYQTDIDALEKKFGRLEQGMKLELNLQEALDIMPRNRKRSDSYNGLCSDLEKALGVELRVTSRKNSRTNDSK